MPAAWIFGTRHDVQGLGPNWTTEMVGRFLERCTTALTNTGATAIAEESCSDSVGAFCPEAFSGQSALGEWCQVTGLDYLNFDLNEGECEALGLPHSLSAQRAELEGQTERAALIRKARFEGREAEWVKRLTAWQRPSVVTVVGADHVESLSTKLEAAGWCVTIIEERWLPT